MRKTSLSTDSLQFDYHSRKKHSCTNNIKDGYVQFKCPKWNVAAINFISNLCGLPVVRCENICSGKIHKKHKRHQEKDALRTLIIIYKL